MAKTEQRKVDTGIVQRGNTYRFTVCMGYDVNGKQIRKTTTFVPPTGLTQKKAGSQGSASSLSMYLE